MNTEHLRSLLKDDAATLRAFGGMTPGSIANHIEALLEREATLTKEHEDAVLIARAITTQRFLVVECMGDEDDGMVAFVPFTDPTGSEFGDYIDEQMESAERLSVRDDGFILLTDTARDRLRSALV